MSKKKKKNSTRPTSPAVPAGAKAPTDHQQASAEIDLNEVIDLTLRGVELKIPLAVLDDFELLDDIGQMERGNAAMMPSVLRRFVDEDQYIKLMDTVRDPETGRVSIESGGQLIADLLGAIDPN